MNAISVTFAELRDPYYYGYEVYFGLETNSHLGALTRLSKEIEIRKCLHSLDLIPLFIEGHRVVFEKQEEAQKLFDALR